MKFHEQKLFNYDGELWRRHDVNIALKIQAEYVRKHSPVPPPRFFEVARDPSAVDPLWHMPLSPRTQFSRTLDIPAINIHEKTSFHYTQLGLIPQRRDKFWLATLILASPKILEEYGLAYPYSQVDYFPMRGDMVFWQGYRYMINNVAIPPEAVWGQTNIFLGVVVEAIVVPDGDAKPVANLAEPTPSEISPTKLLPEI